MYADEIEKDSEILPGKIRPTFSRVSEGGCEVIDWDLRRRNSKEKRRLVREREGLGGVELVVSEL